MVKLGWDKLKRFLAQANTWSGTQTFANAVIQAGSVAASVVVDLVTELLSPPIIGKTLPKEVWASPSASKGPAIINSGFTGTISRSTTTLTFSAAADAILAGYAATNPILGTTVIHPTGPVTMYITAWINSTSCTVDSSGTLAAQTPTSFQLPIATFVNSAGVTQGWMNAAGNAYFIQNVGIGTTGPNNLLEIYSTVNSATTNGLRLTNSNNSKGTGIVFYSKDVAGVGPANTGRIYSAIDVGAANIYPYARITLQTPTAADTWTDTLTAINGNVGIGTTSFGTSVAKILAIGGGTMPAALVADAVQLGVAEYNGATGDQRLNIYSEATVAKKTAIGSGTVSINGAVTSGGGFTRQLAEAVSAALSGATGSIAVNVPSGARILGVQLRVDTAITSDNVTKTWAATYVNTPTTAITTGQVFDANTKFNAVHPAYEITTGTVTITITAAAGLFTGGVVRGIVYFENLDNMSSL